MPVVASFLFDDENEEKFASHGLDSFQVLQVLSHRFTVISNRKGRRGTFLIIGTDDSGQCIAIPIEQTYQSMLWRPITAWYCKESERSRLPH